MRSEASQAERRNLSNLSNNGHAPAADAAAVVGNEPGIQAAQWDQGLHMEALANLAHELRSPVQALLGYLDILRDEMAEASAATATSKSSNE